MKVSIITISYNNENGIAATIESVLNQSILQKPDQIDSKEHSIEYLIIDGASKDHTVAVAESYAQGLEEKGVSYRIYSEPDGGIYDAMNKGIRLATGDIIGILNSEDTYEQDTLETVVDTFQKQQCELMFGNICMKKQDGTSFIKKARLRSFQTSRDWNHPTTFVKAQLYKENPFRNMGIHDDYGFFLQMKKQQRNIVIVDKVLANFQLGGASNHKSMKAAVKRIKDRYQYCYRINGYSRFYLVECIVIEAAKMILG